MKLLSLSSRCCSAPPCSLFSCGRGKRCGAIEERSRQGSRPPSLASARDKRRDRRGGSPPNEATAAAGNTPQTADADPAGAKPAEPKTHLLAREQADAERSAALKDKTHATAPAPPDDQALFQGEGARRGHAGSRLAQSEKAVVIRIDGIAAREADETCKRDDGTIWPCGAQARGALIHLIRTRAVTCTLPPGGEAAEFAARCSVMGQDLSAWLVRQGWATPKDGTEPALGEALKAAKTERLGLWGGG